MKKLLKYRLVIAAVLLAIVSVPMFRKAHEKNEGLEQEIAGLNARIDDVQGEIDRNLVYAGVQDQIEPELKKLKKSRKKLYSHFSSNLLEEDQIRYVLYLEQLFGNEMSFAFGKVTPIANLSDGSSVGGVALTVNVQTTYQGFKDVVAKLATDSQVASVDVASLSYDPASDTAVGSLTVTVYTLSAASYEPPAVSGNGTGKEKIFE